MFKSLEFFVGQTVDLDILINNLTALRYNRVQRALGQGEFSQRGGVLDIYPLDFDAPLRIDFEDDKILSIATINVVTGKSLWHSCKICLPIIVLDKIPGRKRRPL